MDSTIVIGAGFSGLATAAYLAKAGHKVTVLEKNSSIGGRARQFTAEGYTFDMGPSWYWMPDVFERFFADFGKRPSDYYELVRLDPSYSVYFEGQQKIDLSAKQEQLYELFEALEPGSSVKLKQFMKESAIKYEFGVKEMVYKPGLSVLEFFDKGIARNIFKLHLFESISKYIRRSFTNPKIIQLLEFPVLFLGAMPQDTPAMYSLMNYADIQLGTWYPMGGMFEIIKAMAALCIDLGVDIVTDSEVLSMKVVNNRMQKLSTTTKDYTADSLVVSGDYEFFEQNIIPKPYRNYTPSYWDSRKMAPGSLIFYLGLDKRIEGLEHHTLFFDTDFTAHTEAIYKKPAWPDSPLFYVNRPSKTDPNLAPEGHETLMILIPLAPDLQEEEHTRQHYLDLVLTRIEHNTKQSIREHIKYERSYAHKEFIDDYHAFKGNAYGLANTLKQTAILKPSIKSKLENVLFAGQLTVPGPGVPPSLISGKVVANQLLKTI